MVGGARSVRALLAAVRLQSGRGESIRAGRAAAAAGHAVWRRRSCCGVQVCANECAGPALGMATARDSARSARRLAQKLAMAAAALGSASMAAASVALCERASDAAEKEEREVRAGEVRDDLPTYALKDVAAHTSKEAGGIWVVYKRGVYDISEFIENHPGGAERIILAAGGSVEPFWSLYQQHYASFVHEILEELRIGNLSEADSDSLRSQQKETAVQAYLHEPARSDVLLVRSEKPFNAEPPPGLLVRSAITPIEHFYKRNHFPIPAPVQPEKYELEIALEQSSDLKHEPGATSPTRGAAHLSLERLRQYPKHSVTATLQCAGNRRTEMAQVRTVKGGAWDVSAIGTATWSGPRLADVLREEFGLTLESARQLGVKHVHFSGLDTDPATPSTHYAASVPVELALDPQNEAVLAYEMNGETLPLDHGFPLRAIIPGVVGARNVKWLESITLSATESNSHWQKLDYKGFAPNVDWDNVDYDAVPAIQELPVQSSICETFFLPAEEHSPRSIISRGFAWSGGGRGIIRVEVSADGGQTWHSAKISPPEQERNHVYAWTLWEASIPLSSDVAPGSDVDVVVKATDSSYNTQPESIAPIWNIRGVLNNAWHHVSVRV